MVGVEDLEFERAIGRRVEDGHAVVGQCEVGQSAGAEEGSDPPGQPVEREEVGDGVPEDEIDRPIGRAAGSR